MFGVIARMDVIELFKGYSEQQLREEIKGDVPGGGRRELALLELQCRQHRREYRILLATLIAAVVAAVAAVIVLFR